MGGYVMWPNPVSNELFIYTATQTAIATLIDATGRKLKKINIQNGVSFFDMSHLPSGRYIVTITIRDGSSSSYNIIKK
jgi:hypothetical protein